MPPANDSLARLENAAALLSRAQAGIRHRVVGQDRVVDLVLVTLLAGGHALLVGVPGLAKTMLVETAAIALGLDSARVQCTPDLMPADITGSEVLEEGEDRRRSFRFIKGPVFTQFLMADEINRASPRTQSALLQAMQERVVSVAGQPHALPEPFHVLATQNPIEQEGTYALPEAQLDRFLMQIDVGYPDLDAERAIVLATTSNRDDRIERAMSADDLLGLQRLVRDMPVGEKIVEGILTLVRRARPGPDASAQINRTVAWAPGLRASQALMLCSRARALLDGRAAPSMDDVLDLAAPVLKHRMALNYQARADGITFDDVLAEITRGL